MIIPPWSYSSLDTFENCPKRYYHRYILKEREPENEVTKHGNEVHKALELRVKDGKPLPEAYKDYEPLAKSVADQGNSADVKLYTEMEFALDQQMQPCSFWDKNVWGRGKGDVVMIKGDRGWLGDWKTGKVREKADQLKIFAAFLFKMFPVLKVITGNNIWLTANKLGDRHQFSREHEPVLWKEIIEKVQRVEKAFTTNRFDPKPSGLCGFCNVKACPHNRS